MRSLACAGPILCLGALAARPAASIHNVVADEQPREISGTLNHTAGGEKTMKTKEREFRMNAFIASLAFASAMLIQPAWAQQRLIDGFDAARACHGDIEKLCSGIEPGGGRIKACIQGKANELSMGCKEALAVLMAAGTPVDVKVGPVEGKIIHIENAHNYPFCEFGLVIGDSFETAEAHIWNTTGTSDCPPKYRDPIDAAGPEAFARKHGALAGWLNPRRHWMFDEFWVYVVGNPHDFDGVMASWMAKLPVKTLLENASMEKTNAYQPAAISSVTTLSSTKRARLSTCSMRRMAAFSSCSPGPTTTTRTSPTRT
jgi:hypothetical protein